MHSRARLTALGSWRPSRVLTNEELSRTVDTTDEWIVSRTGIRERHIAAPDEFTSDLCVRAVEDLRARSGKHVDDVDLVIAASTTPDYYTPSVAAQVQARCGIAQAGALDVNAACAGFAYALHVANALITAGLHRKILVVAGETLSKVTDYTDRSTCVLFGDGAGAVLVEEDDTGGAFLAANLGSHGEGARHLYIAGLSHRLAADPKDPYLRQNGREIFRWAVATVSDGVQTLIKQAGLPLDDVTWLVPHSANLRIIEGICKRLHLPKERALTSIEESGNTSAASIPLALDAAVRAGKLRQGDVLAVYGFGGGLVHAGLLLRWTVPAPAR